MYDECFSMNNCVGASLGIFMSFTGVPYKNNLRTHLLYTGSDLNEIRSIWIRSTSMRGICMGLDGSRTVHTYMRLNPLGFYKLLES